MTVVAAIVGVVAGFVAGWWVARRRAARTAPATAPLQPAALAPRWTDVVDRLTLGVVVTGASGQVHYRNKAAKAMAGTHIGLLVDEAVDGLLAKARNGEETQQTLELYGPPRLAVVVTAAPLESGGAVATIEDVSERRRVDAVRTDFVANISHELKTPIGAMAVLAETLGEEDDLDVVHRVADRMLEEAHRVTRTIDDLLELSRIELGEEPMTELIDVGVVVEGAVNRVRHLGELKDIAIEVLELPDDLHVRGDGRQLQSALGNLVENAVKYSEPGSSVQVRVRVVGRWVELMVADHGIGIPAGDHDRIFERFYRVDKGRGRETGGTGLGLSIVRHVVTNHRGHVLVSSQEGEGSTFVLRLPLASVGADAATARVDQ